MTSANTGIRRGHGFDSRSGLNFFSGLISQLLKLSIYCDDLHLQTLQLDPLKNKLITDMFQI